MTRLLFFSFHIHIYLRFIVSSFAPPPPPSSPALALVSFFFHANTRSKNQSPTKHGMGIVHVHRANGKAKNSPPWSVPVDASSVDIHFLNPFVKEVR